jgi:predicted N-acetyltransferase YhbS
MHQPTIRAMRQTDLDSADRVHRVAFGTRFGLPDPSKFRGDAEIVRIRWATDASTAFIAESDDAIVGGACAMDWGSVLVVGPVFVHPDQAGRGVARLLMAKMIELAETRAAKLSALFTFPESATHLRLYESFGFASQALTPIMRKAVGAARSTSDALPASRLFSKLAERAREDALQACRRLTDAVFPGLDLTREIRAVAALGLGDTILLGGEHDIRGFALCHHGAGSEAGSGTLFVKFAAVRLNAEPDFTALLTICERLAATVGAARIEAGTNAARAGAYRVLRASGYRAGLVGVAMHRPDGPGYNRPDVFAIDDWR